MGLPIEGGGGPRLVLIMCTGLGVVDVRPFLVGWLVAGIGGNAVCVLSVVCVGSLTVGLGLGCSAARSSSVSSKLFHTSQMGGCKRVISFQQGSARVVPQYSDSADKPMTQKKDWRSYF